MVRSQRSPGCRRSGVSLVEALIVIAVVGLLVALALPAIQRARDAANKAKCQSRLHQIGIASQQYEEQFGVVPRSIQIPLLSYLGYPALAERFKQDQKFAAKAQFTRIPELQCPSDPIASALSTNYGMNEGPKLKRGPGFNVRPKRYAEYTDGMSATAFAAEVLTTNPADAATWGRLLPGNILNGSDEEAYNQCMSAPPATSFDPLAFAVGTPWPRPPLH